MRVMLGLVLAVALCAPAQATTLEAGESWFIAGPRDDDATCGARCWEYELTTAAAADALRIGVDHVTVGEVWTVAVDGPDDWASFGPGTGLYSQERVFTDPQPGTWTLRVTANTAVRDLRFRLRAKLEDADERTFTGPRLPNLQALPPWDLSFQYPLTNGGAVSTPGGSGSTGIAVPGGRTSCHPEEVVLEGAVRCLRMAFGVRNTGDGPMALTVGSGAQFSDRALYQHVLQADDRFVRRDAGSAVYHHTHQHYHHDKAIGLTLWRVTDRERGGLVAAAPEHLKGFAHRNELLREWTVFYPLHPELGFGLRAGWGDYYEWDRPGNYIDFGLNEDGLYVLRLVADPVAGIAESDEGDNAAYSLVEVTGTTVKLLESGRGSDPWDPCRILVPFGPEPDLPAGAGGPRPAHCPPDSSGLPGA